MTDYTQKFLTWWGTYPRDRRKAKPKCFEVWKNRNLEARADEVVAKLEADVSWDPQWQPGAERFIPLSQTYLNQGRYDDDPPRPPKAYAPVKQNEDGSPRVSEWWKVVANFNMLTYWFAHGSMPVEQLRECMRARNRLGKEAAPTLAQDESTMRAEFGQIFKAEIERITGKRMPAVR